MISRERRFKRRFNFEFPTGEGSRKCWAARGSFDVFKTAVIWTETGGGWGEVEGVDWRKKIPSFISVRVPFSSAGQKRLRQTIASRRRSRSYRGVLTAFRTHSLDRMREFHVKERGEKKTFLQEKIRSSTEWLLLFNPRSSTSIGFIQPEGDLMSKFLFFSFFFRRLIY